MDQLSLLANFVTSVARLTDTGVLSAEEAKALVVAAALLLGIPQVTTGLVSAQA